MTANTQKRRVVVTGYGSITAIGLNAGDGWAAAKAGRCGIVPITAYDTTDRKVTVAGEATGFVAEHFIEAREVRKMDRFTQLSVAAADEAMAHSKLDMDTEDTTRCGCIVSSGIGGLSTLEHEILKGDEKGYDRISPFYIPMSITNIAAGHIAIRHKLQGMCSCVTAACAGGTNAVGDAFRHIRDGYADVMVCGGAESAITPSGMGGFTVMKALSTAADPNRASIPFDKERSGFVMGEGAGILVLETLEHAQARGAMILGEVVGYGATCDAHHITAPLPDGAGSTRCMQLALEDGGLAPADIGYINAHGTSTPMNDPCETAAIKAAFGAHADQIPVSSTKSMTGHLLGAAGAVEAIFTLQALLDGFLPPTINYRVPDEACDLDIIPNVGRAADIRYAMSNSLGFGGHNAALVFKKWEGC
ncbi:MAG: beta-ketoacyl-ACP synthase II [Oscillospiraceae bacterium]|nr:beta-ketoacyl-ACP synthase II [Oscillospiraceae bacterium]